MTRPYFAKASKDRDEQRLLDEKYGGARTAAYEADRKRLARGEPLAYVIGWQPFLGLKIYLDSKPLIPRPETEWWTENLLQKRSGGGGSSELPTELRFLDLCAGSGAIGCAALAHVPNAQVFFGDIDPAHEATIRKNIRENGLDESRADVRIGDLFEPFPSMTFDVIAANPPYVPASRALPKSVSRYEPPEALYAGKDGLAVIRRIAKELHAHLAADGVAWVECDSEHASEARELFAGEGRSAKIRTDQYDVPRLIVVHPAPVVRYELAR